MTLADNLPEPERRSPSRLASYLLLALTFLWCVYWFVHAWHYWEDDAYIHLEFARSVAAGRGFAFNGRVVDGDTAPLWVFLLAAMHVSITNWMIAGKVLTVLGAAFGFAGIYAFARRLSSQMLPLHTIFPAAMVLLIAVNPYSCYWLFSGMEPIAAAGLACFAILAATRNRPTEASFLTACLLAGVAPLLRPEMIFLAALLLLPLFAQARTLHARSSKPRSAIFLAALILLAAPLALWSIYSLHAFGHILPNTNAAKRAPPGDSVLLRVLSIYSAGFPAIVCGLIAGIASLTLRFSAVRRSLQNALLFGPPVHTPSENSSFTLPLSGWIFILWGAVATVFYIANHTYVQTRYILVSAPGLTIVTLFLFLQFSRLAARTLYVAALVAAVAVSAITVRPFIANKALACQILKNLALYVRNQLPPNAPVASYAIGEIAFVSQHPIVDTGGITRPESIPYGLISPGALLQWAQSEGAQYNIAAVPFEPGATAVYTADFPFTGWTFSTSLYTTSYPVSLWKLPPIPSPTQQGSGQRNAHHR